MNGMLAAMLFIFFGTAPPPAATMEARPSAGLPSTQCLRLLRSARIARMRGDTTLELETLRDAARSFPDEIAPMHGLLGFHSRQPLPDEERQQLYGRFTRLLGDPGYEISAGVLTILVRDPDVDTRTLRLVLEKITSRIAASAEPHSDMLRLAASLQERLGELAAAAATLERLRQETGAVDLEWRLIRLYRQVGDWPLAAVWLERMTSRHPGMRAAYVKALGKAGRYEEVLRQLELLRTEGSEQSAHFGHVLVSTAWNLRDAGMDEEAGELFRRAFELRPEDEEIHAVLLNLYGTEEQRQEHAAARTRKWEEETDPRALFDEGAELLTVGDAEAALELFERAAPGLTELEPLWYNLGMAAYRLERWARVESAFLRAIELNPERAASYFFRGVALWQLERCAEAVAPLERTLELEPERSLAHYYLAICYRANGEPGKADAAMQTYQASEKP